MDPVLKRDNKPIPILLYHSVDDTARHAYARWTVPPATLRRQLKIIAAEGYRVVNLSTLAAEMDRKDMPENLVGLTFDDGLLDFVTGAMPVLQDFGFPATLFVVTGCIGGTAKWLASSGEADRPMMTWNDLRDVAEHGIECGAHTVSHRELDTLSRSEARDEVFGSKRELEDRLGRAVNAFAYPFGYASKATKELVREAGFAAACRVNHAISAQPEDRFGLSRIIVSPDISDADFKTYLAGRGLPVAPAQTSFRRRAWRTYRTLRLRVSQDDRYGRPGPLGYGKGSVK